MLRIVPVLFQQGLEEGRGARGENERACLTAELPSI
jgi:hypothetical protein